MTVTRGWGGGGALDNTAEQTGRSEDCPAESLGATKSKINTPLFLKISDNWCGEHTYTERTRNA